MDDSEKREVFNSILKDLTNVNLTSPREGLEAVVNTLTGKIPYYNWIWFYMVNSKNPNTLSIASPLQVQIPSRTIQLGQGKLGQVANSSNSEIISQISPQQEYQPHDSNAQSAIVVPIIKDNILLGELIVESHTPSAFNAEDQAFLTNVCKRISGVFERWRNRLVR
jgi:L-methionine (R)-S-oxide reductase